MTHMQRACAQWLQEIHEIFAPNGFRKFFREGAVVTTRAGDDTSLLREAFLDLNTVMRLARDRNHPDTWLVSLPADTPTPHTTDDFWALIWAHARGYTGGDPRNAWDRRTFWMIDTTMISSDVARLQMAMHAADQGPRKVILVTDAVTADSPLMAPYVAGAITPYQWDVTDVASLLLNIAARYGGEQEQQKTRLSAEIYAWRHMHNGATPHPDVVRNLKRDVASPGWPIPTAIEFDPKFAAKFMVDFWGSSTGVSAAIIGVPLLEAIGGNPRALVQKMACLPAAEGVRHPAADVYTATQAACRAYHQQATQSSKVKQLLTDWMWPPGRATSSKS